MDGIGFLLRSGAFGTDLIAIISFASADVIIIDRLCNRKETDTLVRPH